MVTITRQRLKFILIGLASCLVVFILTPASASSANISRAYHSTKPISAGSLLSLDPAKSGYVQPANTDNAARLLGIAVRSGDSLLAVNAGLGTVQVATSGIANALVSNLNGNIKIGDQISSSPFDGIGMKAQANSKIIGLALSSFSLASVGTQQKTVTDSAGNKRQISVGSISINIALSSLGSTNQNITGLQKVVKSLTGKVIPTERIVIAVIITGVTLISLIALIYGSVYSTIISVGRNPLAQNAIYRSTVGVIIMTAILAAVSIIVVLLLLN